MTIRKTLLISFLMFSIVFAALMTALAYSRARSALSDEIRSNLESQALTVMQQVDAMLFERIKDMQGWRRLDLMQELKVGDIDKRLASFLGDIKSAYAGVYTGIYCVQQTRIVSASDAALIGTRLATPPVWMTIATGGAAINVAHPEPLAAHPVMILSSEITDAFGGGPLATLSTSFNWDEITALLDLATARSGREALLLDADGQALALSKGLRAQLAHDHAPLPSWHAGSAAHGVLSADDSSLGLGRLLVGYAHSTSYKGLADLGWTLLILTPESIAFGAVQRLLWSLVALLAAIVAIAALLAIRISAHTARPIQSLTAYARAVGQDIDTPPREIKGASEVEELNQAFNRTLVELRASRAHLVRASKLAAAGEMAAKLAHEVRTPLGIIRSSAQLINRQSGLDARAHEMMSYMINEVDRINELVTRLLDSARSRALELRPHTLAEIVRHVLDMLHDKFESCGITVETALDGIATDLDCDRDQMLQVLLNLLLNASQVLEHGGRVHLAIESHDNQLALLIDDDGPGIPLAERDAIFEPFVSYRAGGIGLGLSVVREVVSMHGGTITAGASALGGARFTLLLPRRRH